jgi:transcriptional regulator GlxA family with amidase domain
LSKIILFDGFDYPTPSALLLPMAGLIEGRSAVTHHLGMDVVDATGTHAIRACIIDDGDLVWAGGVTSGIDLGIYLLERLVGPDVAIAVKQLFEFERRGTTWRSNRTVAACPRSSRSLRRHRSSG